MLGSRHVTQALKGLFANSIFPTHDKNFDFLLWYWGMGRTGYHISKFVAKSHGIRGKRTQNLQ